VYLRSRWSEVRAEERDARRQWPSIWSKNRLSTCLLQQVFQLLVCQNNLAFPAQLHHRGIEVLHDVCIGVVTVSPCLQLAFQSIGIESFVIGVTVVIPFVSRPVAELCSTLFDRFSQCSLRLSLQAMCCILQCNHQGHGVKWRFEKPVTGVEVLCILREGMHQ